MKMAFSGIISWLLVFVVFLFQYFNLLYHFVHSKWISNSNTVGCPPVHGDNPRALASGLSYVHMDKHDITLLYHLHQSVT